ncbi:hypothetical protein [Microbacterium sp. cx-59]|uniref:hypothetical protein n=1 Tax=Microbacterium sp. cx-59 TaxID=2891207 RepID=UPI001E51ABE1|nr:hypothetical protein [Microbacterium sp. cx-59]MCC4907170.1 hypothetical protein [Microbacterium sp. cx-59]
MSPRLRFPDAAAAADALTFAGRVAIVDPDASVRLVAASGALAMTAGVLAPRSLLESMPTVLAMRVLPVDAELECDLTVTATGLTADVAENQVTLPETSVRAAWAGVSPPRSGWERAAPLTSAVLATRAQWGMAAVAHELPTDPGEDVVRTVRARIWGENDPELNGIVRGAAFAAVSMGFVLGDETIDVLRAPGWTRLTLQRGHVLIREPRRSGLTAVRATGR